jgi:hypothetical protein
VDPRDSGICGAPYGASPCGDTFTLFYLNIQRFKSFHPTLKNEACRSFCQWFCERLLGDGFLAVDKG